MKTILFLLPISLVLMSLNSCVSTPASRIQDNQALYYRLSSKHQELVRQGKIERGMSKPAVFLAMGSPANKTVGVQHGKKFERWNYDTLVPVYHHGFSPYYGYGYGCGRRGGYYGVGYQPSVHYEPRHGATVQFRRDKVTGWSRKRYNF